jgi:hypothetical protein
MPLVLPAAPAQSIETVRAMVPTLAQGSLLARVAPQLAARLTQRTVAASLSPTQSYRIYTLGVSDLASAAANGFRAAALFGWRHVFTSNGEVVSVDVSVDSTGANHQFAALRADSSAVQSAIAALGQDPALAGVSYEVSLLQIPALGVKAIWLHDASGRAADVLVPVAARAELVVGRRYDPAQFTAALADAAAKILANDDPRKGA